MILKYWIFIRVLQGMHKAVGFQGGRAGGWLCPCAAGGSERDRSRSPAWADPLGVLGRLTAVENKQRALHADIGFLLLSPSSLG